MPNTSPTADCPEVLDHVLRAAARAGPCEVVPVSAITEGLRGRTLVDMDAQAASGAGAFSDDGAWVASEDLASEAFRRAAANDWLVMEHCEDFGITGPGVLHDAPAVRAQGIAGIPREAEDRATARDLELARRFGTRLHLCHVSTAAAVAALRRARDAGLRVSGEVTPHHLVFTVEDAVRGGADFKMKPPLREAADVEALVRGLEDGTIEAIGTDHAPHAEARKGAGLAQAPFGAIGMETAFPVLYTRLVRSGRIPLARLVDALVGGPARVTGRTPPSIRVGARAQLNVIDIATRAHRRSRRVAIEEPQLPVPRHDADGVADHRRFRRNGPPPPQGLSPEGGAPREARPRGRRLAVSLVFGRVRPLVRVRSRTVRRACGPADAEDRPMNHLTYYR